MAQKTQAIQIGETDQTRIKTRTKTHLKKGKEDGIHKTEIRIPKDPSTLKGVDDPKSYTTKSNTTKHEIKQKQRK